MSNGCTLTAKLNFDREQSCIEIETQFKREPSSLTYFSEFQTMALNFYIDSIESPEHLRFNRVNNKDEIPPVLKEYPNALKYFDRQQLWVLDLKYITKRVVAIEMFNELNFTEAKKVSCVTNLRQVLQATHLKHFMRLNYDFWPAALEKLKKKMRFENSCPPF